MCHTSYCVSSPSKPYLCTNCNWYLFVQTRDGAIVPCHLLNYVVVVTKLKVINLGEAFFVQMQGLIY